eukprot:5867766-Karenia_brevis.AAC.1
MRSQRRLHHEKALDDLLEKLAGGKRVKQAMKKPKVKSKIAGVRDSHGILHTSKDGIAEVFA